MHITDVAANWDVHLWLQMSLEFLAFSVNVDTLVCEIVEKLHCSLQCNVTPFTCQHVRQDWCTELQAKLNYGSCFDCQVTVHMISLET